MFSEINSLVFLLIFLVYAIIGTVICQRVMTPFCAVRDSREILKKIFLCGLGALMLTVITICLWYAVIIALLILIKYLYGRCTSKGTRRVMIAGFAAFMALVAAAGIQLMLNRCAEGEEDALQEEMIENESVFFMAKDWKKGR